MCETRKAGAPQQRTLLRCRPDFPTPVAVAHHAPRVRPPPRQVPDFGEVCPHARLALPREQRGNIRHDGAPDADVVGVHRFTVDVRRVEGSLLGVELLLEHSCCSSTSRSCRTSGGVDCGSRASRCGGAASPLGSKANAICGCLARKTRRAGGGEPSRRRNASWSAVRAGEGGSGTVNGVGEEHKEEAKRGDEEDTLRRLEERTLGLISTSLPLDAEPVNTSTTYAAPSSRAISPERRTKAASARARTARHSAKASKTPYAHVGAVECVMQSGALQAVGGVVSRGRVNSESGSAQSVVPRVPSRSPRTASQLGPLGTPYRPGSRTCAECRMNRETRIADKLLRQAGKIGQDDGDQLAEAAILADLQMFSWLFSETTVTLVDLLETS